MKILAVMLLSQAVWGQAQTGLPPAILRAAGIDQKLGAQTPLDVPFSDESRHRATLRQFSGKPILLALVYYQCPSLCNMVLNGVLRTAKNLRLSAGRDYQIVAVSFDPRETAEMAAAKKETYLKSFDHLGADEGWHFLTGDAPSSRALADSVGFHYAFDQVTNQYAHGSALILLTPDGKVAKYFYGIEYPARDVRLAIVEASNNHIGSPVDQVMLYCYHYDPATGKYGLVVMNAIRIAALFTLAALATFMIVMFRRDFYQEKAG